MIWDQGTWTPDFDPEFGYRKGHLKFHLNGKKLCDVESVLRFRREHLDDQRMALITLHHSLYYSSKSFWHDLLANLYQHLLAEAPEPGPSAAIHAVLMACHSDDPTSTTWLFSLPATNTAAWAPRAFSASLASLVSVPRAES